MTDRRFPKSWVASSSLARASKIRAEGGGIRPSNRFTVLGAFSILYCPSASGATVGVLIDTADLLTLIPMGRWAVYDFRTLHKGKKHSRPYVCTKCHGQQLYMHRVLSSAPAGLVVDHINGRATDNRRSNLRVVSHKENQNNRRPMNRGIAVGVGR